MPFFSRFKNKGAQPASKSRSSVDGANGKLAAPHKPKWQATWNSASVDPEEIQELIHACTAEMKTRAEALDAPFLLLPFRPDSDSSRARSFIRNFFKSHLEGSRQYSGAGLQQELRLTEAVVLCSIMKWCWSRVPGGVVSWPVYEGFEMGEKEANMARNAFDTFISITSDSPARTKIILSFFDLLAAVAAHGKMNGMGGRKLSRLAGWWAFAHSDDGKGFEGGYKSWTTAADAASHLFFAYLRSLSPEADPSMSLIERIPRSLQALLASTEYPPETPTLLQRSTPRVLMVVDAVSPTPFALIRRAKQFEYRDNDRLLWEYSEFEDPLDALTDESKRILYAVSSTNSSAARSQRRALAKTDESWSAFENMGFAGLDETSLQKTSTQTDTAQKPVSQSLRSHPRSRNADHGRPTTPSWADFLSSGFEESEDTKPSTQLSLPPETLLPPITSQQTFLRPDDTANLAPGELAAITSVELDDAFWWVWMTSLASEEPSERKAVFGRCALVETNIMSGHWLIMEEQVKGASPDPAEGAYIAPKKSFFSSLTKRSKLGRKRSTNKPLSTPGKENLQSMTTTAPSKTSLAPDQHSKIKQAAAALKKQDAPETDVTQRRGRTDDGAASKTNSMLTLGLRSEAGPAMKWTSAYDKNAIRAQYLGDSYAGRGVSRDDVLTSRVSSVFMSDAAGVDAAPPPASQPTATNAALENTDRTLPPLPKDSSPNSAVQPDLKPSQSSRALTTVPGADGAAAESVKNRQETETPVPAASPSTIEKETGTYGDKEIEAGLPPSPTATKPSRKAVPNPHNHPAFRKKSVDESKNTSPTEPKTQTSPPKNAAAIAAARAMDTKKTVDVPPKSPTQFTTSISAKPKKQESSTGIKKLFGRKKDNRQSMDVQAAATNGSFNPQNELAHRLSIRRRVTDGKEVPRNAPDVSAQPPIDATAEPMMPDSHSQFDASTTGGDLSRTETLEHQHAEREFSRFDQGPAEEVSVATVSAIRPQDSHEHMTPSLPRSEYDHEGSAPKKEMPIRPPPEHEIKHAEMPSTYVPRAISTTDAYDPVHDNDDVASEATMENNKTIAADNDRWATIRENAARRAARASEEGEDAQSNLSRPSHSAHTEDGGETSGEETIESRVARIKARVAELTGGMESSSARH